MRLLIVSDTLKQRRSIEKVAIELGFQQDNLIVPRSWDEAVDLQFTKEPFHLAVVDICLWGRFNGGVDYIRLLSEEHPECFAIALTERRGDDVGVHAMRAGACAFINANRAPEAWELTLKRKLTMCQNLVTERAEKDAARAAKT